MFPYHHSRLSLGPDSIRLLRLKPCKTQSTAKIHCELFDYNLQDPSQRTHLYDALSYVWGNPEVTRPIYIGQLERELPVTTNLYAALLHLRNSSLERIIWIDAICIDQKNDEEKAQQIQLMAKIYSQASRVLVWLGEAADNSDQALKEIRAAGRKAIHSLNNETIRLAIDKLLKRDWFQRIWILQEVAAARHILIMCGPTEIDGYAFCLGIDSLKGFLETRAELQSLIRSVTYLIRGAIFRTGGLPQAICTLGELIDMYHSHEATLLHDKVYALLGMSGMKSNDLSNAKLLPNYGDKWEELLQRLAKFLLSDKISVEACSDKEIASIKSKGCILGKISSVQNTISLDGRQGVDVIFEKIPGQLDYEWSTHWTLQPSATPIQGGDLICLLQGASKPSIIRLRKDYFLIVMIAASPLETGQSESEYIKWPKLFARDFLLLWDWVGKYEALVQTNGWESDYLKKELGDDLENATRTWNVAMILDDAREFGKADEMLREAIKGYEIVFKQGHLHTPKGQCGRAPLSWAAGNGYDTVVDQLLTKDSMDLNLKDSQSGQTPLSWAARNGHEVVVKLLLATGQVEIDLKDEGGRTPLLWAARNGHETVVKLLLATGQVEIDLKDKGSRTPFWWAAGNGYEAVVKLLLATSQVEIDLKDKNGRTPLWWATRNGHETIVKLLLATGQVEIDSKDEDGQTPLWWATKNGHETIFKLLLATGQVEVDSKDEDGWTPLLWAVWNGHEAVIKLLLATGQVEVNSKDKDGWTPLWWATKNGHEAIVKLLLATGQVEANSEDKDGWTPLLWAVREGYEAVVKLLLATGQVEVNSKDDDDWTPLLWAIQNRHETIVKLLLATGQVEVDLKDEYGGTPLWWAVQSGHEAVVKLLLATGEVEVNSKDEYGRTPLWWAAKNGHEAVVKLLREHIS